MRELESWALGYLVNALWQVPVVFCAAWVIARMARRAGPAMRHKIWVTALLLEAALPACPMRLAQGLRTIWAGLLSRSANASGGVQVSFGPGSIHGGILGWISPLWSTVLMTAYGLSVVYFGVRLAWGLWQTRAMRLRAKRVNAASAAGRLTVLLSREIAGPVTVGLRRAVVMLPHGFLDRVGDEDLRAVLAHEGAHVNRRDFLKNALYSLATLPIALHPALWRTRRRIDETREMICDAMAAETVAGRERYAGSLLRLASLQVERTPYRMLHAIGIFGLFDANSFERRIMTLTEYRKEMKGARRIAIAVACGVLGLGTCATALALRIGVPMQQSEGVSQPTGGDSRIARVSGGVMAGNVLSKVNPVYPPDAKAEGISGAVVMSAVIGTDGAVENLQVVSGPEKLRKSALDAVRQWTYKPYILNGVPVSVQTTITVNYSFGGG